MSDEFATYRSLKAPVEHIIFKERKSKFIGFAYPVQSQEEIKTHLSRLKGLFADANHICYAWKIGVKDPIYRVQDDGEPRNSAGVPIYGQINSLELTNTAVFVVRYFGGVKLGVGGLISAYKATARNTLELADIEERTISCRYSLAFDYTQMNTVLRIIGRLQLNILERILKEEAMFIVEVPLAKKYRFLEAMNMHYTIKATEVGDH